MITLEPLPLPEVLRVRFTRHEDPRGAFMETYAAPRFAAAGLPETWLQDNEVLTGPAGAVRGLHLQAPPHGQAKLVRAVRGRIFDVAVDVRRASPAYGRHVAVVLDAAEPEALYIPEGFAHGYCTLTPDALVHYKVTRPYAPGAEQALLWCDPALAIAWPVAEAAALVSPKDAAAPPLARFESPY